MSGGLEYQVVSVMANDLSALTKQLNVFGKSGWDVVAVLPLAGADHVIYMKREDKKQ